MDKYQANIEKLKGKNKDINRLIRKYEECIIDVKGNSELLNAQLYEINLEIQEAEQEVIDKREVVSIKQDNNENAISMLIGTFVAFIALSSYGLIKSASPDIFYTITFFSIASALVSKYFYTSESKMTKDRAELYFAQKKLEEKETEKQECERKIELLNNVVIKKIDQLLKNLKQEQQENSMLINRFVNKRVESLEKLTDTYVSELNESYEKEKGMILTRKK